MALTVIGIFDNATEAQQAVTQLVSAGFSRDNIDMSAQTGTTGRGELIPDRHQNTSGTRTEEVTDKVKDTGDSIGNFFSALFGGGDDTDRYADVADRGTIVTVHTTTDDEADRAADILDDNGAVDVNERAAEYGYTNTMQTGMTSGMAATTDMTDARMADTRVADGDQTLKVIEENLQVGKRTVETGGVRVRSRIVERPVEESLRLREERVSVQRTPVNRMATDADLNAFQQGEISLTEHAEVAVVNKETRVVEEISVGMEATEREEVIRDTVRSTEVDVEQLGTTGTQTRTGLDTDDVTYSTK
jgi:uncharacterized protein (TIGR02271 family)